MRVEANKGRGRPKGSKNSPRQAGVFHVQFVERNLEGLLARIRVAVDHQGVPLVFNSQPEAKEALRGGALGQGEFYIVKVAFHGDLAISQVCTIKEA